MVVKGLVMGAIAGAAVQRQFKPGQSLLGVFGHELAAPEPTAMDRRRNTGGRHSREWIEHKPARPRLDLAKKMDSRYFCTVNPKEGVMSKRFSEQFKQEAVQLVSAERPIRQVASYLGIGYSTLDKWVRAHRERTGQLVALTQEQKRIRELERQVAHLQEVNDILKKATVYFANPANR